jgi:hypothetical protein
MQHACPLGSRIAFIAQARNLRQRGSWSASHLPDSELTVSEGRSPILFLTSWPKAGRSASAPPHPWGRGMSFKTVCRRKRR